jgi:hypothetical protein
MPSDLYGDVIPDPQRGMTPGPGDLIIFHIFHDPIARPFSELGN